MSPAPFDGPEPFPREPIDPDFLEWARQTFDMEEFMQGVREIEAGGGVRFEDFFPEIEAIARGSDWAGDRPRSNA
jgi:hypothetical protein